ncbi:MAG TPA: 50S ribosomal protein L9 [Syntrophorhabdaceae bacterium]|jgi:large subunit ribosomal protein L9|nr:50S ribosomal protein L9 [Syntrophorhabdaceae bacterium]MDI9560969.1 50S ribosomal protein L9 [Pseudomonadota bacterium]OQC48617.1 MAG: 50S ribosomal protein L9 [Deltaproteobacteria bacterium ADurb.Bin026]MBP8697644.1 50S ribosomal protein L9 [Syntrophorhabdaceae bacterium]MBV6505423.1 50S ribosomal protein L9 [Syntrophorhabdaceae bacterium]
MKVILTEDLRGSGKRGETIEVKEGFGRNFLIPKGLALPATEGNIKKAENIIKERIAKKERDLKTAADIKIKLEEVTLNMKKKAGIDGKLFGSITNKDVAEAVKTTLSFEIDKKDVKIKEPIKVTGLHEIEIHLEQGITANVKVEVENED